MKTSISPFKYAVLIHSITNKFLIAEMANINLPLEEMFHHSLVHSSAYTFCPLLPIILEGHCIIFVFVYFFILWAWRPYFQSLTELFYSCLLETKFFKHFSEFIVLRNWNLFQFNLIFIYKNCSIHYFIQIVGFVWDFQN